MSGWMDRISGGLRDRSSSVMVATALAGLIVLGVLAVLIVTVRGAQTAYSTAAMTVSVAEVTEDAINVTQALQQERVLASTLGYSELSALHERFDDDVEAGRDGGGDATAVTDAAMQDLRVTWSEHRTQVPDTALPPMSDVLAAGVALTDFRKAAAATSGESPYALYSETIALAIASTSELVKQRTDPTTVTDRLLIVALLGAVESLHAHQNLIQQTLVQRVPLSEEALLELNVHENNIGQRLLEARSFAGDADLPAVDEIRTGSAAELTAELEAAVLSSPTVDRSITPRQWFEASSARIEQVNALIPTIHERLAAEAAADLDGAGRALWIRSILLGALFVLSILVASNAVFATRERGEALAEYGQLADGLRQWFVAASFPDPDSVEIAARYIPASVRTRSGGDWYDVYEVGEALAVVIGDVAGHGAEATAQMAQVRNLLRGQSTARTLDPASQIDLLSKTISNAGIIATLTYGLLDISSGEFVYTRAGHIPLLIRSASGSVRVEEEAPGPPVGGGLDLERETQNTQLEPGDVLILITDGLVERVDRDIDLALDQIAKALTETDLTSEALLDRLFDMNDHDPIDDAAALLITWKPQSRAQVT
ncbi:MAG: PP2C family protein-serine/threonine phosphatase [Acidimicrobiia bacterium]